MQTDIDFTFPMQIKPRPIAGAVVGFAFGLCIDQIAKWVVPVIMSITQGTDVAVAKQAFESSIIASLCVGLLQYSFAALVAGFVSRTNGILSGILANSLYALFFAGSLVYFVANGIDKLFAGVSIQLFSFANIGIAIFMGFVGGRLGERMYAPEFDEDLFSGKRTILGIRWGHYFWIFPFIVVPYFASFLLLVYVAISIAIAEFYFSIHPSLWLKLIWWSYFILAPIGAYIAFLILFSGASRFGKLMQSNSSLKGLKLFRLGLLSGVGAPLISYWIGILAAVSTHALPRPQKNDWIFVLIIFGIMILIYSIWGIFYLVTSFKERSMVHSDLHTD